MHTLVISSTAEKSNRNARSTERKAQLIRRTADSRTLPFVRRCAPRFLRSALRASVEMTKGENPVDFSALVISSTAEKSNRNARSTERKAQLIRRTADSRTLPFVRRCAPRFLRSALRASVEMTKGENPVDFSALVISSTAEKSNRYARSTERKAQFIYPSLSNAVKKKPAPMDMCGKNCIP